MDNPKTKNNQLMAKRILGLTSLFILLSWLAVYLIDLRNIFGLRDVLFNLKPDYFYFTYRPFLFQHWGRNSGLGELVQWFFLASSALLSVYTAGRIGRENKEISRFLIIMAIAFLLMLLEDAGDIRHTLMGYVQAIFKETEQGWMGTLTELLYFGVLAGVPLYGLIKYWKNLKEFLAVRKYLLTGFIAYALAGGMSFIGTALSGVFDTNFYTLLGEAFYNSSLYLGDQNLAALWQNYEEVNWDFPIGFFMVDSLLEESFELIGGAAFLGASYMLYKRFTENKLK